MSKRDRFLSMLSARRFCRMGFPKDERDSDGEGEGSRAAGKPLGDELDGEYEESSGSSQWPRLWSFKSPVFLTRLIMMVSMSSWLEREVETVSDKRKWRTLQPSTQQPSH